MDSYAQISEKIKELYKQFSEKTKAKYVKEALLGTAILVIMFGGYMAHDWYKSYKSSKAFAGLLEVSKSYEKALEIDKKQEALRSKDNVANPWEDVDVLLDAASASSSGSNLSPFFLIYEAELTWKQDKKLDKAVELMKKAVSQFSSSSIFYHIFNLKRIKMQMDSSDAALQKDALVDLTKLSQDPSGYCFEEALYLLSMYHLYNNKLSDAVEAWKRLVENKAPKSLVISPWVKQAQEKLKAFGVEVKK